MKMHAVPALWRREVVKFVRDGNRVAGAMLQPVVVWLLLGFGFRGSFRPPTPSGMDIPYLEFLFPGMIALVALFTSIFSTISIVEERHSGFLQAALAAPVRRLSLVLGAALGSTTLAVGQGLLFFAVLPLTGHVPTLLGFVLMVGIMALVAFGFAAVGIVVAWQSRTTRGFHAVMNLCMIPLWVLSGAFFPAEGAPATLQWAIRLNPLSHGIAALRTAMYWPQDPPIDASSFALSLAVTGLFAAIMLILAARTSRKSVREFR
ncbi:MAG: ABC transporter permease subunit [Bacteroidetes bacterium SB0662_bin_6]|nr:ABC transporter permease subunit [Bacteroidetes bacterium SB0668_bin_1]MYE04066.1 ABC transporter permease subunit [Bacteroidetes bacterium SB0662_bin_6]